MLAAWTLQRPYPSSLAHHDVLVAWRDKVSNRWKKDELQHEKRLLFGEEVTDDNSSDSEDELYEAVVWQYTRRWVRVPPRKRLQFKANAIPILDVACMRMRSRTPPVTRY